MRRLFLIALTAFSIYFAYQKYADNFGEVDTSGYSIPTADQKPIPKNVFYELLKESALNGCSNSIEKHNLSPEECRKTIETRSKSCASKMMARTPDLINSKSTARENMRPYLDCVTPYYFCNGVEVKNEEEVRAKCK